MDRFKIRISPIVLLCFPVNAGARWRTFLQLHDPCLGYWFLQDKRDFFLLEREQREQGALWRNVANDFSYHVKCGIWSRKIKLRGMKGGRARKAKTIESCESPMRSQFQKWDSTVPKGRKIWILTIGGTITLQEVWLNHLPFVVQGRETECSNVVARNGNRNYVPFCLEEWDPYWKRVLVLVWKIFVRSPWTLPLYSSSRYSF